jgi:hypothetical protein
VGLGAPLGHEVHAEIEVVKVLGKRIEFKVSAHDELEEIGPRHPSAHGDRSCFVQRAAGEEEQGVSGASTSTTNPSCRQRQVFVYRRYF